MKLIGPGPDAAVACDVVVLVGWLAQVAVFSTHELVTRLACSVRPELNQKSTVSFKTAEVTEQPAGSVGSENRTSPRALLLLPEFTSNHVRLP